MNIFAFLMVLITLSVSNSLGIAPADNWQERLLAVLLVAGIVPAIALFQCAVLLSRFRDCPTTESVRKAAIERMLVAHTVVWLIASVAVVWALRWQDVVRGNWNLGGWPVLDELIIILPGLLAMLASWAVFYELELFQQSSKTNFDIGQRKRVGHKQTDKCRRNLTEYWQYSIRPRFEFIALRFRLQMVPLLLLVGLVLILCDLFRQLPRTPSQPAYALGTLLIWWLPLGTLLMICFPLALLKVWPNERFSSPSWINTIDKALSDYGLTGLSIRSWNTGNRIANAAVIGMLPRLRWVLMSDVLLDRFPKREVEAIFRHELGHIRYHHAFWRIGFMLLPMVVLAGIQSNRTSMAQTQFSIHWGDKIYCSEMSLAFVLSMSILIAAAWLTNRWLNHQLEFEADLSAAERLMGFNGDLLDRNYAAERAVDPDSAVAMQDALLRLTAYSGVQLTQSSFFHPSIKKRIEFLQSLVQAIHLAKQFRHKLRVRRILIAVAWIVAGIGAAVLAVER